MGRRQAWGGDGRTASFVKITLSHDEFTTLGRIRPGQGDKKLQIVTRPACAHGGREGRNSWPFRTAGLDRGGPVDGLALGPKRRPQSGFLQANLGSACGRKGTFSWVAEKTATILRFFLPFPLASPGAHGQDMTSRYRRLMQSFTAGSTTNLDCHIRHFTHPVSTTRF